MKKISLLRNPAKWNFFIVDDRMFLICIAVIVGAFSGFAAVALNWALHFISDNVYQVNRSIWTFLIPALGAGLSSFFLEKIVKDGQGHGVPEVISSVSRHGGLLRLRSSFSRLISSCLTIGSGGSAGPEAPVVMSGSAIGSNIAKFYSLNERQRVTLVGCGAAGAISSIFNAPIAGMVFAIEVIIGEWKAVNIIPIAIASVVGTEISHIFQGNQIAFSHRLFNIGFHDILASLGMTLILTATSILLTRLLRFMHKISGHLPYTHWMRAAIGGCAVGILGTFFPVALGEGYHWIKIMIEGSFMPGITIVAVAVLIKIIATSFTLGWGGSGGIFAPSLVIGGLAGLTYHRCLVLLWPAVQWSNEGCFALLGMAGLISGMLQAPLTGIFLIVEITGGYEVILPLILISVLTTTMCHYFEPASFYLKELIEKGQLLRPGTDERVLADLSVQELLEKDCIQVNKNMMLREFVSVVQKSHRNHFPVIDEDTGNFIGMIRIDDIRSYLFNPLLYDAIFLEQIMNTQQETVHPDDDLAVTLKKMDTEHLFSMPVVKDNKFLGMISKATLLDQYRKELMVQTSQSI